MTTKNSSSRPMKNVGVEYPTRDSPTRVRSCHLPRRRAAKMPARMPVTIQRMKAPVASSMLTGKTLHEQLRDALPLAERVAEGRGRARELNGRACGVGPTDEQALEPGPAPHYRGPGPGRVGRGSPR